MKRFVARASVAAMITLAAASAFAQGDEKKVVYMPADKVTAAFARGGPMIETGGYKLFAGRRDKDGQAEVHARDTDVIYVLEGTATIVTGGQVTNGKTTAPDETRGDAIASGDERPLVKGDIVIVPNGVPHLFKDVKAPFLYYVVKVTSGAGSR